MTLQGYKVFKVRSYTKKFIARAIVIVIFTWIYYAAGTYLRALSSDDISRGQGALSLYLPRLRRLNK